MKKTNKDIKFVLYLDIMGFKDRVNKVDVSELKEQLLKFKTKNKWLEPLLKNDANGKTYISMAQFSDSIVLVSESDSENDLKRISRAAAILMQTALETGFALRGAIARGEMIFDDNNQLFFGKALVDAYLLEEELSYYGVVFHESVEYKINNLKEGDKYKKLIEDIEIPLKKGKSKHYHIAWHKLMQNNKIEKNEKSIDWLNDLRKTVSGNPRVYLDNTLKVIVKDIQNNQE